MNAPALSRRGALVGLGALAGCTSWRAPAATMAVERVAARCPATAAVVMLPGVASLPGDFVTEGFVAPLQASAPATEVLLPDAHLGYLVEERLLPRLAADVVDPLAARGVKPWLVGISLGGFAALLYAMRHGEQLAGVLVLAPYLGRRELLRDISAAGGPLAWRAAVAGSGPATLRSEGGIDADVELWRWLADPARRAAGGVPPVYLGYGGEDRFADALRATETLLPDGHSDVRPGGHDWPVWRALWQRWLARGLVAADCRRTRMPVRERPV